MKRKATDWEKIPAKDIPNRGLGASQTALVVKNTPVNAGDKRHRFDPWVGKIPHAVEHLSPCARTTEDHTPRACAQQKPLFSTTRERLQAAKKTQCSQELIFKKRDSTNTLTHCLVAKTLRPIDCSTPGSSVLYHLLEFAQTCLWTWRCYLTISSSAIPFSFCLQSCPESRSFPVSWLFTSSGQRTWWSFSINSSSEYPGLISFNIDWLDLRAAQVTLKSFSSTIQKHQFFGTQPSFWSSSHIWTWLLEKLQIWLYGPLFAK